MDSRITSLTQRGDKLHSDKLTLNSLYQEISENFYPERADFTRTRYLGQEFASDLMSSYPVLVRRELGDAFSSMLRPTELSWFEITVEDDEDLDRASRTWLEHATRIQRRAMYDRVTQFVRATKQGDHDFATFGGAVISSEFDASAERGGAMLYRTWHLRDCAWSEGYNGEIDELHINWNPTLRELSKRFPGKLHQSAQDALAKEPLRRIKCRRVMMLADDYEAPGKRWPFKWISVYIDLENQHVLLEESLRTRQYVVPRWQTVSGSQYAFSPATIVGLPDARLIQAMTLTLLEAGEQAVRPPLLASADVIREDVQNYAGGITWIDADYDKRKQDVLRPLTEDKSGLPFGMDFADRIGHQLASVFYLNKLTLPPPQGEMTAYETRQRIEEYLRVARPLFEPAETEYNGALCDSTFQELMPRGAFGPITQIPPQIAGRQVKFKFESPLHQAIERQDGVTFLEGSQLITSAMSLDGSARYIGDVRTALRDALHGIKFKGKWMRDVDEVDKLVKQAAAQEQEQQQALSMQQRASAVQQLGEASKSLA